MTDPGTRRRFDDEQVSLILRRAAELQEEQGAGDRASSGLTLADLEEVAREAGLDPALVRRAAAEVGDAGGARTPAFGGSPFLGAPTVLRAERIVDGELPTAEFEAVLDEIRREFNDVGIVSALGRTLAWRSSSGAHASTGRQISVTVVARGGTTGIRVEESTGGLAGGLFGGLMGGLGGGGTGIAAGVGMGAFHSLPLAAAIWTTLLGGSYVLARTIFASVSRRRAGALTGLADRLAGLVEEAVAEPPGLRRLGDS
jgi:hypothetical protein